MPVSLLLTQRAKNRLRLQRAARALRRKLPHAKDG